MMTTMSFSPCYVCTDAASPRAMTKVTKHINSRCILCGAIDPVKAVSQAWDRGEPVWLIEQPLGTRLQEGPYETRAQAVDLAEAKGHEAVAVRLIKGHRDFLEIPTFEEVTDEEAAKPRALWAEPPSLIDGRPYRRLLGHGFHRSFDGHTYEGPFPGRQYKVEVSPQAIEENILGLLRLAPPGEHVVEDIPETIALWRGA